MATAGVSYHVGREAKAQYDEQWAGVQTGVLHHKHHFDAVKSRISPYWILGDHRAVYCHAFRPRRPANMAQPIKSFRRIAFACA